MFSLINPPNVPPIFKRRWMKFGAGFDFAPTGLFTRSLVVVTRIFASQHFREGFFYAPDVRARALSDDAQESLFLLSPVVQKLILVCYWTYHR